MRVRSETLNVRINDAALPHQFYGHKNQTERHEERRREQRQSQRSVEAWVPGRKGGSEAGCARAEIPPHFAALGG